MTKIQCGNFFIDFSQLKEGLNVDGNNEFLKKYDKDGNSIFSMQEIEQIKQDIEAAAGNDKKLQENEALNLFINKLGISAEEAKTKFATFGNAVTKGLENLNNQREAATIAHGMWNIIDDNFIIGSLDSKKFNEFWNKVNENNIVYVLEAFKTNKSNKKNESLPISVILETTSSETTKRKLIDKMFKMLKANIDTTKYDISSIEKEYSELKEGNNLFLVENRNKLDNLFNTMLEMAKGQTATGATTVQTTEVVKSRNVEAEIIANRKQGAVSEFLDDVCGKLGGVTKENVDKILAKNKEIEQELEALKNDPIKFAEKFEYYYGVKYSPEAVENYNQVNANYKEALRLTERDAVFDEKFAWALKTKDLDYLYTRHGLKAAEDAYERTYKDLCEFFGKEHIDMVLQTQCSNIKDCKSKYYVLQQLITEISSNNKAAIKNHMGNKTLQMMKDERDGAFRAGFGMQNDAFLEAEHWSESQQKRLSYTQMGVQILAMAGAMFTGGGTLALLSTATILADPIGLVEQMTDPDGMTSEDWKNFMTGRAETLGWMALGLATSGVGAFAGSFVKMKGLATLMQKSGKSLKSLLNNPNLPADVAKQIKSIESLAKTMGISTEVALDIVTTAALQKEGATTGDWIASIAGAIAGGSTLGKNLNNSKNVDDAVKQIQNSFLDFKISKEDALKILEKIREKNKQLNAWAKSPTKSSGNMYSSIIPISPTMLEKAAKFVTRIVTDGVEKLFKADGAHTVAKLKTKNPIAYNAVTDMFTEITTQLCAGRIPSKEMLDEVIEKTAKKYAAGVDEHGIDTSLLREYFDAYTDYDGWNQIKEYFNKPEAVNAKKMDEIEDAMSYFKDTCDLNMPENAVTKIEPETPATKAETPTKVDATATPKVDETMDVAQLFDAKHLNALSKLDENTYNAVITIFDTICKEVTSGKVPSKEMYDRVIADAVKKFGIDKSTIEKQVKHFMGGSGWDVLSKYLSRPEANNLRNGQPRTEVNDAINYFKKKRGIVESKPETSQAAAAKNENSTPTTKVEEPSQRKVEETAPAKESFEITDELAEKYKYELDQPFHDRKSEANLVKIMENYHSLIEGQKFDYKNIDQELEFLVSQNGITNFDDITTAVKLIKERFHKDILADIQRVKDLSNKYNLPDETIRKTDNLINEIKNIMASGKELSSDDILAMIYEIDGRTSVAQRIENLIYDNPEIKNYLNDCTHRDVWNNPEIIRNYNEYQINEATKILDQILAKVENGAELTDELIKDLLSNMQHYGTDELLYKLIEDHHKLGPLYKNMEGNPTKK